MTPGSKQTGKSKNDLDVTCGRPGYQTATISKSPGFGGSTFGNIIAGGVVGVVVHAASGANDTYPSEMHVEMAPIQPAAAAIASQPTAQAIVPAVKADKPTAGRDLFL